MGAVMKFDGDPREWYFILVEEWLIPTESGRVVMEDTYDTLEGAMEAAREHLEREMMNFSLATGYKSSPPSKYGDLMYVIDNIEGQEETDWYDCVKVVPIPYGVMPIIGYSPESPIK